MVGDLAAVEVRVGVGGARDVQPRALAPACRARSRGAAAARAPRAPAARPRPTATRPSRRAGGRRARRSRRSRAPSSRRRPAGRRARRRRPRSAARCRRPSSARSARARRPGSGCRWSAVPLRAATASTFAPSRRSSSASRGCRHASGSSIERVTSCPFRYGDEGVVDGDQQPGRGRRRRRRSPCGRSARRRARRCAGRRPPGTTSTRRPGSSGRPRRRARRSTSPASRRPASRPVSNQRRLAPAAAALLAPGADAPRVAGARAQRRAVVGDVEAARGAHLAAVPHVGAAEPLLARGDLDPVGRLGLAVAAGAQLPAEHRRGLVDPERAVGVLGGQRPGLHAGRGGGGEQGRGRQDDQRGEQGASERRVIVRRPP